MEEFMPFHTWTIGDKHLVMYSNMQGLHKTNKKSHVDEF